MPASAGYTYIGDRTVNTKRDPYAGKARPAADTWQEGGERGAQDLWNDQYEELDYNQNFTRGNRGASIDRSGSAFDRLVGYSPSANAAYNPSEMAAYDPNSYFIGNRGGGGGGGGGRGSAAAFDGGIGSVADGGALAGYTPGESAKFDASDVSDFDPSEYGGEYARGAFGEFSDELGDEFDRLTTVNAGTGRLKTGWFDRDRGKAAVRIAGDFNNKLAQAATTFSGQRLQALSGGADLRLRRAQGIDTANLTRAEGIDRNAISASSANASTALQRQKFQSDAAFNEEQLEQTGASDRARLGLSRAQGIDANNLSRAHDIDSLELEARRTGLSSALDAERMARGDYNASADRMGSYASGTREWAAQDRQSQDERDYTAALDAYKRRQAFRTGVIPSMDPGEKAARKMATSYGVPYRG